MDSWRQELRESEIIAERILRELSQRSFDSMVQRFVLCAGFVDSQIDGQRHHIDARRLAQLYQLRRYEYIVLDARLHNTHANEVLAGYQRIGLVPLRPRTRGDYAEAKERAEESWRAQRNDSTEFTTSYQAMRRAQMLPELLSRRTLSRWHSPGSWQEFLDLDRPGRTTVIPKDWKSIVAARDATDSPPTQDSAGWSVWFAGLRELYAGADRRGRAKARIAAGRAPRRIKRLKAGG